MSDVVQILPKGPTTVKKLKKAPSLAPQVWNSTGIREKPAGCQQCRFRKGGSGFVPDWYPADEAPPKIGFLLSHPTSADVLEQKPWSGAAGYVWEREYLRPYGLFRGNVFIGHVIRCLPKERRFGKPLWPTGSLSTGATKCCRQYDDSCWGGAELSKGGIAAFAPTLFLVTFHPEEALSTPALGRLIRSDIGRAVRKAAEGYRPLVLMGDEAKDLVAPWAKGSVKFWRGTYWEGSWPFKAGGALVAPAFIEA